MKDETITRGRIRDNIAGVQERIAAACRRAGRRRDEVRLLAVSKTVPPARIREAFEAGMREFGENRVQEAISKRAALADLGLTWHLIGRLQANKARPASEIFQWIQSIDSARLADRLHRVAADRASTTDCPGRLKVLLEVNLGGEPAKSGVSEAGCLELAREVGKLGKLDLRGLMAVPPFSEDFERSRPYFSRLRELGKVINSAGLPGVRMEELSMGMSDDFEVAVEEGATLVRVGTAIFGARS